MLKLRRVKKMSQTATIKCAFCDGQGKDPFELLSELAKCQVCGGRGNVTVVEPYVPCAHCKATGVNPGSRNVCTSCNGRGVISTTADRKLVCSDCGGSGRAKESNLPCLKCSGKGVT